jgi:hypothetical protein
MTISQRRTDLHIISFSHLSIKKGAALVYQVGDIVLKNLLKKEFEPRRPALYWQHGRRPIYCQPLRAIRLLTAYHPFLTAAGLIPKNNLKARLNEDSLS